MEAAAPIAERHLEMIEALIVCAGELAQAAARMAKCADGALPCPSVFSVVSL